MARYINAERLINWLWGEPQYNDVRNDRTDIIEYIDNIPTADVVEVVRCKDCIDNEVCEIKQQYPEIDFCNCGKKKERD